MGRTCPGSGPAPPPALAAPLRPEAPARACIRGVRGELVPNLQGASLSRSDRPAPTQKTMPKKDAAKKKKDGPKKPLKVRPSPRFPAARSRGRP